jgi:glucarate dehydratase
MGNATGRPVCQLLGGQVREVISFAAYVFYRHRSADGRGGESTPKEIVRHTAELIAAHGFRRIKLKGGLLPPLEEYRATAALREAFPENRMRFDPNGFVGGRDRFSIWVEVRTG